MLAYIGLGSNLDNPQAQLQQALLELAEIADSKLLSYSPLYRSKAVGPGEQPDYINAVASLETGLPPLALLDALQEIERSHQRVRNERWGPRTLDLDILLLDQEEIDSERLKVPHPYLTRRNFVLYPLADIAPDLLLPNSKMLKQLINDCSRQGLERLT